MYVFNSQYSKYLKEMANYKIHLNKFKNILKDYNKNVPKVVVK